MKVRHMKKVQLTRIITGICITVFFLAGCGQREPFFGAAPVQANDADFTLQSIVDEKAFLDRSRDEGKLSIRYFHFSDQEKGGDSIYIEAPDGSNLLIDAGYEKAGKALVQSLSDLGVDHLDAVVATHPHHDHIGGFISLLDAKHVGRVYMPKVANDTILFEQFVEKIKEKAIPVSFLERGDVIAMNTDVQLDVLGPPKGTGTKNIPTSMSTSAINNLCLVLKLHYGERTFLFTCDVYKRAEFELTEAFGSSLKADMLHAPHHGNHTSSSIPFIQAVRPKLTIFSSHEVYSKTVYENYRKSGSRIAVTGIDGNILILCDGNSIQLVTQRVT
ncbi:ComEC/Rec2 family competence protein [Marinicrinis lubricantis]|uniref:ComEC/Rec2 family competence protein n=1 Tax=Marinicrinis lubricantis TaxID=2086470 RepID=A0ABW1IR32_9BACL